jgi:hypothetical protein
VYENRTKDIRVRKKMIFLNDFKMNLKSNSFKTKYDMDEVNQKAI